MQVKFKDIYKIGFKKIDQQHEELFDTFNKLDRAITRGEGNEVISEIFDFLTSYTREHFVTEEHYMEKYKYPDIEEHKMIHKKFLDELDDMYQKYQNGYLRINSKTQELLFTWITSHIEQTDKRYGMYLVKKIKGIK